MKRANADAVQRAVDGPDYDAALAIINGRVEDAKDAQSAASGRASAAWADVEKLGVNKRGAQMFAKIKNIEDDKEQQDQLRTFYELCKREGIMLEVDLVDQAEGKTSHPVPGAAGKPEPIMATAAETEALADEGAPAPAKLDETPKPRGGRKPALSVVTGSDAKDKAKAHLGTAPDALA